MKYLSALALGSLTMAPAALHAQATTPAPAAAVPAVGSTIVDSAGATIGTVDGITAQAIVINTGTTKIAVPPASVGKTATGFALSITKADLMAAQAQQQAQAGAALKSKLVAGTAVSGLNGKPLGTIKTADAQTVTLTTAKGVDVKLPVTGFGPGASGGVVLGLTAEQLDAATAGATPGAAAPTPAAGAAADATTSTGSADAGTTPTDAAPAATTPRPSTAKASGKTTRTKR